ncbi:hypothetical protein E5676_scaffold265G001590 [Cucumis melo var. makuwa]|uniref:Uncharacterized protein n=1 Tax=Cucumis melo var. makuwa TaxID=1194695 RepID=A0A5D3C961_CUCMM|nr:hypothetical protein E6C27_scaffold63G001580 [Cucumis melo var. makuwa]TYK08015.1 hypothetical protein E5676_scaffold265G001590 [Cucumis melo var. makuwa]
MSSAIPPPSQSKLPKNRGNNLSGKEIRSVEAMAATLEEEIKEHKDESDSSKSDHHWKRPLKKAKVSGDDPDGKSSSALGVPDVPSLSPLNDHLEGLIELDSNESLMGPHEVDSTIEEVGTSKTPVSKPVEQSLRPSALLEEIHRGKMTVGEKDIGSPPSKGDACPKTPLQKDIQDKIMQTPFEYIVRLRPEIETFLSEIEKIHADGLTPLEEYLNSYLKRERATQLSLEKKELERRLYSINAEFEQLSILSCEKVDAIDQKELEVPKLQVEVNTLEITPTITEEAIKALATVRRSMEVAQEEFKNFKWKL